LLIHPTVKVTQVAWLAALTLTAAAPGWSQTTRIAAVAIQDRSVRPISTSGMDATIRSVLGKQGFEAVTLTFAPPADVEYQARLAGCSYILYTDIAAMRKSAGRQIGNVMRMLSGPFGVESEPSPDTYVADVEFRLFGMDEVLPRISTTVSGKTSSSGLRRSYVASDQFNWADRSDSARGTTDPENEDEPNAQLQAKRLAVTAALERVAREVRTTIEKPRQDPEPAFR
jgi:hypothetical protein